MSDRPAVTTEPGMRFGYPQIRGISVDVIGGTVWAEDVTVACREYGLTRGQVLIACWWLGRYGDPEPPEEGDDSWRDRWGTWAGDAELLLARGDVDYDAVPDPPWADE